MKGGQGVYATKIVTVWTVAGPMRVLNGCQAPAQAGKKQYWGDQPLFDQSDLYVTPEALIYEIFTSY